MSPTSSIGRVKMIFEPVVRSAQTVHLCYIKNSTISRWTKTSFHISLITKEYHRVRPKRFLNLWYVWRNSCTYLAPTLTLSPNGPKWNSTWPTSPRSSIGCVQNDFQACGTFGTNVHLSCVKINTLQMKQNGHPLVPLGVPSGVSKMISVPMVHLAQTIHLSCTDTNTISKWSKLRFHMTHIT
jgi:hypothetical protein